jgi:hypothetical protein
MMYCSIKNNAAGCVALLRGNARDLRMLGTRDVPVTLHTMLSAGTAAKPMTQFIFREADTRGLLLIMRNPMSPFDPLR